MKNTDQLMRRIETLIVVAEAHVTHGVEVPDSVIALVDVLGPLLMENLQKTKGWTPLKVTQAIIEQRRKVYIDQGLRPPEADAIDALVELLTKAMGPAPK